MGKGIESVILKFFCYIVALRSLGHASLCIGLHSVLLGYVPSKARLTRPSILPQLSLWKLSPKDLPLLLSSVMASDHFNTCNSWAESLERLFLFQLGYPQRRECKRVATHRALRTFWFDDLAGPSSSGFKHGCRRGSMAFLVRIHKIARHSFQAPPQQGPCMYKTGKATCVNIS